MEDVFLPIIIVGMLFIGLPWVVLHYMTQWRRARSLSVEDERLLDEMHDSARRLDDRINSIERILTAENPRWREISAPSSRYETREIEHDRAAH